MGYPASFQTARRSLQSAIGPGPSKRLRPAQELESRVLLYDLVSHGDQSIAEELKEGPNGEVPERHWFSLIRRYVSSTPRFPLVAAKDICRPPASSCPSCMASGFTNSLTTHTCMCYYYLCLFSTYLLS